MKIYLLKKNLQLGLGVAEKTSSKSSTLPILESVLISAEKNVLKLIATNLENTVVYTTLAKVDQEGSAVVPVKIFSDIIRSIKSDKINIEKQSNNLVITGDNEKLKLRCQNPEDFPIIPKMETEKSFNVNSGVFMPGISQVINTVSSSFNKPELSGVYFKVFKDGIIMASTDSFRLSEKKLKFSKDHTPKDAEEYSFIVPIKILNDVTSFFFDGECELNVLLGNNQISLENADGDSSQFKVEFTSRLIEGDFPNYQEIIPNKFDARIVINRHDLLDKIKAASILSPRTNEVSLSFSPKQKRLELTTQNPDSGDYHSYLSGHLEGEEVLLDFNWRYVAGGLTNMKSQEVIFEVQKNGGPAAIRPVGDDSYIYVVMPIRSA